MNLYLVPAFFFTITIFTFYQAIIWPNKKTKLVTVFNYILMVSLVFFRDQGWDYESYNTIYETTTYDNLYTQWSEPGFLLLIICAKAIGLGFGEFCTILALISLFIIYFISNFYKTNPMFSLYIFMLLYFIRFPYGQIRQSFAITLFLLSLTYLNSSLIKYLVVNVLAVTVHSSILASFPFLIFIKLAAKGPAYLFLAVLLTIAGFAGIYISGILNNATDQLISGNKYVYYEALSDQSMPIYLGTQIPLIIIGVFFSFKIISGQKKLNSDAKNLLNAFFYGIIIYLALGWNLRIADRVSSMFLINLCFIYSLALNYVNINQRIATLSVMLIAGFIYLTHEYIMMKSQIMSYYWTF